MTDQSDPPELRRPLPSFEQWLSDNGDGTRGHGFDALADLAERTQVQTAPPGREDLASFLRMWQGMAIATVELCRLEVKQGRSSHQVIQLMPRILAAAAFYSAASVLDDKTPWRVLAKLLTEEFRASANIAADAMFAKQGEQS